MTDPAPRGSPLGELLSFLGSVLAGLKVLGRRPEALPEVPATNGLDPPAPEAENSEQARRERPPEFPTSGSR